MTGAASADRAIAARRDLVASALRWSSALVMLWAVVIRCLSSQVAQPVFDLDPLMALGVQPGLAIGASLWLDAVVLVAAGAGLLGELRAGRRVSVTLVLLVWLPLVAIAWHGAGRVEHAWRGATWLSAMATAVTLAHLGRDRAIRRMALAVLVAIAAALVVRGAVQLAVEHPDTVRAFDATRSRFLAERGWAPDSPAARLYEERLRQAEASGWFGLANAFSTLMAAGALLAGGLSLAGWRRRAGAAGPIAAETVTGGTIGWCAAIALGCAGLLAVNGSKGAFGALLIGIAVLIVASAMIARGRLLPVWLPPALAALVVLAVVARGVLLPEGFAHERSLLFRWHYLVDAARVIAGHPVVGVGPDGFQEAMIAVRSPRHPEEVASAHNAVVDWWAGLGVFGLAWAGAAAALAARAVAAACAGAGGRRDDGIIRDLAGAARRPAHARPRRTDAADPWSSLRPSPASWAVRAAMLPLVAAAIVTLRSEAMVLDPLLLALRVVGVLVAWATAVIVASMLETTDDDALVRAALLAALCAVIAHAQVELTVWLHGGAAWCLALLGVAAPLSARRERVHESEIRAIGMRWDLAGGVSPRPAIVLIVATSAVGAIVAGWDAMAAGRVERSMVAAAAPISAVGRARAAAAPAPGGGVPSAAWIESLAAALRDADVPGPTIESVAARIASPRQAEREIAVRTLNEALREGEDAARLAAIAILRDAAGGTDNDPRPALALGDTVLRAGGTLDPAERLRLLERTRGDLDQAIMAIPGDLRLLRLRAEIDEAIATLAGTPDGWRRALASWEHVSRRDPRAIPPLQRVVVAARAAGQGDVVVAAQRRILEIDGQLVLDPRKQLDERQREAIRREIAAAEGGVR